MADYIPGFIGPPKISQLPPAGGPSVARSFGGQVITQIRGIKETQAELTTMRTRVGTRILSDVDQRAAAIQARLQGAILAAYSKSATGRMARGIRANVQKIGAAGGRVETVIRITMFNYREANFLTNIGGRGYFKEFPVSPYRIFAKGAEGFDRSITPLGFGRKGRGVHAISGRGAARIAKTQTTSRLKVPRGGAFFTAGRQPGRGGGESRFIGGQPDQEGFFFYPLWVNHPGFGRDVISEVAAEEGARFQQEEISLVTLSHGTLQTKSSVVSRDIPITEVGVRQSAKGASVDLPIFLTRPEFRR